MEKTHPFHRITLCLVVSLCLLPVAIAQPTLQKQQARQILEATGVKGGLVVHVGCGDGKLTAALCADGCYLVHGLDKDAQDVERARQHIQSLGLYGRVSVERWYDDYLPYTDTLP